MNTPRKETPKQAAGRLLAHLKRQGYKPEALHEYREADGTPIYWRLRVKHPSPSADQKSKQVLPMRLNGQGYELKEPDFTDGKPLYRLDALAADASRTVWIVEGESCADALAGLGIVATTSGGCTSADGADWQPLKGRACVVWPDNDEPGARYAADVARLLYAQGCDVRLVAREVVTSTPAHGDVADWLEARPNATTADAEALPTVAAPKLSQLSQLSQGCEPEPLRRPMPPAAEYPIDALGSVMGGAAKAIQAVVQAPAAMCGVSVLAAASLAAQGQADVTLDGRTEPLSLWAVTIGESGERKTGVDVWALGAHRKHEKDAQALHSADMKTFAVEQAAYQAAVGDAKRGGKDKTRQTIAQALDSVGDAPEVPLDPVLILGEPTLEGAQLQLINGWPSLGLFTSDAGEFLGGFSMSRDNKTRTAAALSKLWDNGSFDRVRAKADGPRGKFYGKRLSLHFMAQPIVAEAVLSDELLAGQGFLPRCLLAWPASTIGGREYVATDLHQEPAVRRYWARIHALLDKPFPLAEGTRNELAPRALTLTPDARELWTRTQNAIEHAMGDKGEFASIRAWASKAGSQILRIAGVLTLMDDADAVSIDKPATERAAELVLWHLAEAVRVVGTSSVPADIRNAEALRDWCRETGRKVLCSNEALRLGPGCIRTADNFNAAVAVLERTGWAAPIEGGAEIDGKHYRRAWRLWEPRP